MGVFYVGVQKGAEGCRRGVERDQDTPANFYKGQGAGGGHAYIMTPRQRWFSTEPGTNKQTNNQSNVTRSEPRQRSGSAIKERKKEIRYSVKKRKTEPRRWGGVRTHRVRTEHFVTGVKDRAQCRRHRKHTARRQAAGRQAKIGRREQGGINI